MWVLICTVNSSNTPRSAGSGHGTACRCHPGELDAILEAAAIEDFTVSATDLSIPSTAQDCALHSRLARTLPESVAGSTHGHRTRSRCVRSSFAYRDSLVAELRTFAHPGYAREQAE
jgi:hypothetical protein